MAGLAWAAMLLSGALAGLAGGVEVIVMTGFFQIFNLPVGIYVVSVSHDGFETTDLPGISIREAQASTVNVSLKIGQIATRSRLFPTHAQRD